MLKFIKSILKPTILNNKDPVFLLKEKARSLRDQENLSIKKTFLNVYPNELVEKKFEALNEKALNVFEAASLGLATVNLIEIIETRKKSPKLIKTTLAKLDKLYQKEELGCIYNHTMKYISDYQFFKSSDLCIKITGEKNQNHAFTGAWITRYYLGEELTSNYANTLELGQKVENNIKNIWENI